MILLKLFLLYYGVCWFLGVCLYIKGERPEDYE